MITFLLVPIGSQAQWDLLGNNTTDEAINFVGTLDDEDLRFRTDNTFRLGIKGSNGWLGLNTTAPAGRFHQRHGDFIVETSLSVDANADFWLSKVQLLFFQSLAAWSCANSHQMCVLPPYF